MIKYSGICNIITDEELKKYFCAFCGEELKEDSNYHNNTEWVESCRCKATQDYLLFFKEVREQMKKVETSIIKLHLEQKANRLSNELKCVKESIDKFYKE